MNGQCLGRAAAQLLFHPFHQLGQPFPLHRFHHIVQRLHGITVKHKVGIAGDKDDEQAVVALADAAGRLHAVHPAHLHIQKQQVQFAGMLGQPGAQALAGRKFVDHFGIFFPQQLFQLYFQCFPGPALIVADADADHGQRLLFIRSVGWPAFRLPPAAGGKGPQNGRQKDRPIRGYFTTAARFAKESLCKT